jgi:hypothetical protein
MQLMLAFERRLVYFPAVWLDSLYQDLTSQARTSSMKTALSLPQ